MEWQAKIEAYVDAWLERNKAARILEVSLKQLKNNFKTHGSTYQSKEQVYRAN